MIDENKNLKSSNHLTSSQEGRLGSQRAVKKAKTVTTRVPCGELAQTQPLEFINKPLPSLSPDLSACLRTFQSPGIANLPPEIIHCILDTLPLPDVGCVGQTSSSLNAIVISWLETNRIQHHIVSLIDKTDFLTTYAELTAKLNLPLDVKNESHNTGILLKRVSCLLPTPKRLAFYYKFIHKLKEILIQRFPGILPHATAAINGVILHSLVAGWDLNECVTVFHVLNSRFNIPTDITGLFQYQYELNGGIDDKLYLLRLHIRSLYLDFVAPQDRNMWISIIFNEFKIKTANNAASMLLLLYAPFDCNFGDSHYSFLLTEDNASMFLSCFKALADVLVRLENKSVLKNVSFSDLFEAITSKPQDWSFKAQACLLLCIHFYNNKYATSVCGHLATQGCDEAMILILTEVISVANQFLLLSSWNDCPRPVNDRAVLHLILNALNAGWGHAGRRNIVNELWKDLKDLANDLLDDSIDTGEPEELHDLLETWKHIAINSSY